MLWPCENTSFYCATRGSWAEAALEAGSGWVPAPNVGTQGSNGIGATSVGSLVDTLVEAMTRASDLPNRRADSPLCRVASQILRSASLDWSCTLEWARDGTDQCGINASNLVPSRLHISAAALMTASFCSICSMPSRARLGLWPDSLQMALETSGHGWNVAVDPPQTGLSSGPSADGRRPSAGEVIRFALFSSHACRPALTRAMCTY